MRLIARVAALLAIAALAALGCQTAIGYWSGVNEDGDGDGIAGAATLNRGAAPTASETGSTSVTVRWGSGGLSNGVAADGYIVRRYDAATGIEVASPSGCKGTIAATSCNAPETPAGNWQFTVTPVFATNWHGAESVKSGAVNTGPGSLHLARSLFGGTVAPLPALVTGTVSGFEPSGAIAFYLDGKTLLVGSPAKVAADGTASISVTVPAGTADGPHSLSVRSAGTEASSGILVDNTPPTIAVTVEPPPNAAGWNNSAPVAVGGSVDDGAGSGVAFAKYTDDGSDPKTSPTSQYALGPVSVSASSTLKFYLVDNAGNESPVETQSVKIDTTPPYFTVDFVDIHGGAYIAPANLETGEAGDAFYRGAVAGSLRFQMNPVPLGGSAAIAAGFSALPPGATGFSFDSSSVTMPIGGPFLSNPISWASGTTSTPEGTISLTNEAGNTFGSTGPLHNDSTPPTGGSVEAEGLSGTGGRYSTSLNLKLHLAKGSDGASGLADGSGPSDQPDKLLRASAPLRSSDGTANGSCGALSAFSQVGSDSPPSSVADTVPANNSCYLYRYVVSDHVGNLASYTSAEIKVETGAPVTPAPAPIVLGKASAFAVLGASAVTSSGASTVNGDLGVSPTPAITGFPPGVANGTMHNADPTAGEAQASLGLAYADAVGRSPSTPAAAALGGQTFTRGVYQAATFSLAGSVTLDAQNDPDAVFIFQAGSTLITAASSHVNLVNGAQACNVFWQVGSSVTLGASSSFAGSILALTTITFGSGVTMEGRALAHNAAVTLVEDTVSAPSCAKIPTTPTEAMLTPTGGSGSQAVSGSTLFYNPAQAGSFNVESSVSAPHSGVARMSFPTIAGFGGGGAVSSPVSGNTYRASYSWSANGASPSPGPQAITATDNAGLTTINAAAFRLTKDEIGPSGGAVDAIGLQGSGGRYSTSTTLSVGFTPGTDAGSGLATSGAQLLRASAALTSDGTANGSCGTFGAYTQVGANDPSAPKSDTVPADRTCYRYEYVVADRVGNQTAYLSPEVKVDATAPPAPGLSFAALTNAFWSGAGTTVFYRPGAPSGGFQLTATAADMTAGTSGYAFPTLPGSWSSTSGGSAIRNYSWSASNPTAPSGTQSVTVTNNAGRTATSSFTVTPDASGPSGGSLSYTNGYTVGSSVSISFSKGSDTISGLNAASGIIEVSTATLAAGSCGTFSGFSVAATNPLSGVSLPVSSGLCYQYRYLISDNVGNQTAYTSASVAKVDSVVPTNSLSLEAAINASSNGNTIYYRGNVAGFFRILDTETDTASGPASATFPAIATTGWSHEAETIGTPSGGPYASSAFTWTANPTSPSTMSVVGTDAAGNRSTNASINFSSDTVSPSGGSIAYANGILNAASVPVTVNAGSDGGAGLGTATVRRDVASLNTTTETCEAFPATFATTVILVAGVDSSVLGGNCYQYEYVVSDKVGNQTTYSSASVAKIDTGGPHVTAIESRQGAGSAGNGQLEVGDKLIVTFNQSLATASVPTSFTAATETRPALGNVTLSIPGVTKGALDTGTAQYLVAALTTASFNGTIALSNAGAATTMTITVTSVSGGITAASKGQLLFSPATTITDGGGNAAAGALTSGANFKLF